ncbi:MAG: metallopeptidase TldD-related protein [Verrucomicrobiota bacterium]
MSARVLGMCRADEATVSVGHFDRLNVRFANNDVTTNGSVESIGLHLTVSFGRRSASISVTETGEAALKEAVLKVESIARLSPENPEHMPVPGPRDFEEGKTYAEGTAESGAGEMMGWVRPVVEQARSARILGAGYVERSIRTGALANSAGLFAYDRATNVNFSMTARTRDGRGSGWASTQVTDSGELDLGPVGERAIEKAIASKRPAAMEAGRVTVVLEPAAVRDLVSLLGFGLHRRPVDERRSFLNELAGDRDPVGEDLFGSKATIYSDPLDRRVPCATHAGGIPRNRTEWVVDGVLRNLSVNRFWAKQRGIEPLPGPGNWIVPGEGKSRGDLIEAVDEGVLITRLWYLRMVQPQSLLYTGLTRDGTFRIENGQVREAVNNFRFNESPVNVLRNLVASGKPERVMGSEGSMPMLVPGMVVEDFNLSSVSDAS